MIYYEPLCGYKYRTTQPYSIDVGIALGRDIAINPYLLLTTRGILHISAGYAWDGSSGPMPDVASSMRPSLIHDGLYQLMRAGLLPLTYREHADNVFYRELLASGMHRVMAWICYQAVRRCAGYAAKPRPVADELTAP